LELRQLMTTLDDYGRRVDYLRVSVTDRCNLRCVYCMPEEGVRACTHGEILRYEEIVQVAETAVALGVRRVRLTGGEPLVRLGIVDLVRMLSAMPGLVDLSMTTNGILLARYARDLVDAGLDRVNISLDSLRPDRYRQMTRWGDLSDALEGIGAAQAAGLSPIKINTVVIRGYNDDEVVDLARRALAEGWHLRYIEWMPVGEVAAVDEAWRAKVVPAAEMRERIEAALGRLVPVDGPEGGGPARAYRLSMAGSGSESTLGFITPISEHFCGACNRLRLTADGKLRPCLLADREIDVREVLRSGAGPEAIAEALRRAIHAKPSGHRLACGEGTAERAMAQIGG
jgi:cyclic pyranopterin phosphate synthase